MARTALSMCTALLCLVLLVLSSGALASSQTPKNSDKDDSALYCLIIRTYYGHGTNFDNTLTQLLKDLQGQTGSIDAHRWVALLMVVDAVPFKDLRKITKSFNDPRIQVHAELIGPEYKPKEGGDWVTGYHQKLYTATDEAIRACPKSTQWMIATNGDNRYDSHFLAQLVSVPDEADVVAFDFYSRYQRPTANPCERWAKADGMPNCKVNEMRFCNTDLASNAFKFPRFISEDRKFGTLDPLGKSSAEDGLMASALRIAGWKVHHIDGGKCLVSHAPNAQFCALSGGVWDDSVMCHPSSFGGECITHAQAERKLKAEPGVYEQTLIPLTYDPNSFGFAEVIPTGSEFTLTCLRTTNRRAWYQAAVFGKVCCSDVDWKNCQNLPPHPWDKWLPQELEAERDAHLILNGVDQEL